MNPRRPLNLFYEEPDPDRWVPLDRFPRRAVRRLIRGPKMIGGVKRVFLNLMAGLDLLKVPYRVNDYRHLHANPEELACVIGLPHVLDKIPQETPILLGPSIYNHPCADPDLPVRRPIRQVLQPCDWAQRMFAEVWPDIVSVWPVGIDTVRWAPDPRATKDIDVLIYDKITWRDEHREQAMFEMLHAELRRRGLRVATLRYASYREDQLHALIRRTKAVVYLSILETQGIAAQQMLASGVPMFAWDRGGSWEHIDYTPHKVQFEPVTSVPYWDDRCGVKFKDTTTMLPAFDAFWRSVESGAFSARAFILEQLTLEACARNYVALATQHG